MNIENFESSNRLPQNNPDLPGPESLKNHNRTVATREELDSLVNEYRNKGWEVEEQDDQHVKLKKDIQSVSPPTSRMRSTNLPLHVNITLESKES